jgi:hypothetical protein
MTRTIAALATACLLALPFAGNASAQIPGVGLGIAGGPSFPLGTLAEEAGTGFHVRGSLGLELPLIPLGARADLLWQQFPDEHSGNFTQLGGLLNATWRLPFPIARPYLIGGAGLMRHSEPDEAHDDHVHEGGTSTEFAFGVGAGVQLRLLVFGAFVEARYLDWGHGNRGIPLTFGFTF